ncbi:MAG: hypothetical protein J6A23_04970 [Thermoguttaceae bacterium]|nr:hypothetical protein [Thermoguttaceae bacterium]
MKIETMNLLAEIYRQTKVMGKMSKIDFFQSRMIIAAQENTLPGFFERILKLMDLEKKYLKIESFSKMLQAQDEQGLVQIRKFPNLIAIVASMVDEDARNASLAQIPECDVKNSGRTSSPAKFDIGLRVECLEPFAHGGDAKAGNTQLFRRMDVLTDAGVKSLPFYSGNAVRGQLRRAMAKQWAQKLGIEWSDTTPKFKLWFYYLLTSGGSIGEKDKDDAKVDLGKGGVLNIEGVRKLRKMLPFISVLGGCISGKILPGKVRISDLRPVCKDWGFDTEISADSLFETTFIVRHDDIEDPNEYKGMIANVEALKAGTVLVGGIDMDHSISEEEKQALYDGIIALQEAGYLGGMTRAGFGKVNIKIESDDDFGEVDEPEKEEIIDYLREINALEETAE